MENLEPKRVTEMTDTEIWAELDVDAVMDPSVDFDAFCNEAEELLKRGTSMTREEAEKVLRKLNKQ